MQFANGTSLVRCKLPTGLQNPAGHNLVFQVLVCIVSLQVYHGRYCVGKQQVGQQMSLEGTDTLNFPQPKILADSIRLYDGSVRSTLANGLSSNGAPKTCFVQS